MGFYDLLKSVRNDVRQGTYEREEILLLCDEVEELLNKFGQKNKFKNLTPKDMQESMEARDRAWGED